jgi:hypothetical protein
VPTFEGDRAKSKISETAGIIQHHAMQFTYPASSLLRVLGVDRLGQAMLLKESINLFGAPKVMVDLAVLGSAHCREFDWMALVFHFPDIALTKLTLFTAQLGRVHSFAQDFHGQSTGFLQVTFLFVVLFQQRLCTGIVGADAGGFPATIVTAGVALVKLELSLRVVAGVDEGDAKGSETTVLSVSLLQVA